VIRHRWRPAWRAGHLRAGAGLAQIPQQCRPGRHRGCRSEPRIRSRRSGQPMPQAPRFSPNSPFSVMKRVAFGEADFFSKFCSPRWLAPPRRPQVRNHQALCGFRFSPFRALSHLARQPRTSSTSPEALSHGRCPDSLSWLTAARDRPTPNRTSSAPPAHMVNEHPPDDASTAGRRSSSASTESSRRPNPLYE